jgi:uncharacterized membrane protein
VIKKYLIAGLVIWAPIWVTLLVIEFLLHAFDQIITLLPVQYQPETLIGFKIPGLSLIIILLLIFFTGMLVSNVFGNYVIKLWEKLLARIPLVRSIHAGVKQILRTVFSSKEAAFRKVLLIQYPRQGTWTLAFQTGEGIDEIKKHLGEELITVFVPTTPNPTSGFLLMISRKDVIELDISVDSALKMVISLGVIVPGEQRTVV